MSLTLASIAVVSGRNPTPGWGVERWCNCCMAGQGMRRGPGLGARAYGQRDETELAQGAGTGARNDSTLIGPVEGDGSFLFG